MFDPFRDFERAGYLQNYEQLKDTAEIKLAEHAVFRLNLRRAVDYLQRIVGPVLYEHALAVHGILFSDFYPWAGKDRQMLGVADGVTKGERVQFAKFQEMRRAFDSGLRDGNDPRKMQQIPGKVMGEFAFAHPFLDGNGRTTLLLHAELCHRAGFAIDWQRSSKWDYLEALTREIEDPRHRILDTYFEPLRRSLRPREEWVSLFQSMEGLDGAELDEGTVAYEEGDGRMEARYQEVKRNRGYMG